MRVYLVSLSALLLLTACTTRPPSPEILKELYLLEAEARRVEPRKEFGLLYVLSEYTDNSEHSASLRINGELAMDGKIGEEFYVFCLPPSGYAIVYEGEGFSENQHEFLMAKAGEVYVRNFNSISTVIILPIPPLPMPIPLIGSSLSETTHAKAKEVLAVKRIGRDSVYYNSVFRCR